MIKFYGRTPSIDQHPHSLSPFPPFNLLPGPGAGSPANPTPARRPIHYAVVLDTTHAMKLHSAANACLRIYVRTTADDRWNGQYKYSMRNMHLHRMSSADPHRVAANYIPYLLPIYLLCMVLAHATDEPRPRDETTLSTPGRSHSLCTLNCIRGMYQYTTFLPTYLPTLSRWVGTQADGQTNNRQKER